MRPNLFVNTPTSSPSTCSSAGGRRTDPARSPRRRRRPGASTRASSSSRRRAARREENIDNEKYEYKRATWPGAGRTGLARALPRAPERDPQAHPGARPAAQHHVPLERRRRDARVLEAPRRRCPPDGATTRSSSSRTSTRTRCARRRCTSTRAVGRRTRRPLRGRDLIRQRWDWCDSNYVRLDAFAEPVAHPPVVEGTAMTVPPSRTRPRRPARAPCEGAPDPHSCSAPPVDRRPAPATCVIRHAAAGRRASTAVSRRHVARARARRARRSGGPGSSRPRRLRVSQATTGAPDCTRDDPYRSLPTLGELDLHLSARAGTSSCWHVLGRPRSARGRRRRGTAFAVWAPTPRPCGWSATSTAGTARARDAQLGGRRLGAVRARPRRRHAYKFELLTDAGEWVKARPDGAVHRGAAGDRIRRRQSLVRWGDGDWMRAAPRATRTTRR
jgi:hypothetical protein